MFGSMEVEMSDVLEAYLTVHEACGQWFAYWILDCSLLCTTECSFL